ncbi:MAG: hypothetical protein EOO77_11360, partial [Oxalobacteraceae bacterium]
MDLVLRPTSSEAANAPPPPSRCSYKSHGFNDQWCVFRLSVRRCQKLWLCDYRLSVRRLYSMSKEGYGKTSIRGIASTAASQAIKVGTTIVTTTIVARLLSPSEYGVSAMAGPVAGFIVIFQNLGLNQAVVQAKTITDEESNALFWINMYASLAIALVMLAIGPLVGHFYGDPRPGYFVAATGLVVLVSGLKQQHQALMNREMRFHSLSLNDSVAAIV